MLTMHECFTFLLLLWGHCKFHVSNIKDCMTCAPSACVVALGQKFQLGRGVPDKEMQYPSLDLVISQLSLTSLFCQLQTEDGPFLKMLTSYLLQLAALLCLSSLVFSDLMFPIATTHLCISLNHCYWLSSVRQRFSNQGSELLPLFILAQNTTPEGVLSAWFWVGVELNSIL